MASSADGHQVMKLGLVPVLGIVDVMSLKGGFAPALAALEAVSFFAFMGDVPPEVGVEEFLVGKLRWGEGGLRFHRGKKKPGASKPSQGLEGLRFWPDAGQKCWRVQVCLSAPFHALTALNWAARTAPSEENAEVIVLSDFRMTWSSQNFPVSSRSSCTQMAAISDASTASPSISIIIGQNGTSSLSGGSSGFVDGALVLA